MLRLIQQANGSYTMEATRIEVVPYVAPAPAPDPVPATTPTYLFQDTFDYAVDRNTPGASAIFVQHGWGGAKTYQDGETGGRGYVYTVNSIPGYTGPEPEGGTLCLEALPATLGGQTDFYIQYGNGEDAAFENALPSDVWFTFWIFINHDPSQPSQMEENKFIYACNTAFPCHDYRWMLSLSTNSADPHWNVVDGSQGDCFLNLSANPTYSQDTVVNPASTNPGYEWRMGQTNVTERIRPNRWQEVSIHLDTSTNQGVYEAWIQPLGGEKVKVAEYISEQNGFSWNIQAPGGHRTFRMPTTVGRASGVGFDQWLYLKNFRIS